MSSQNRSDAVPATPVTAGPQGSQMSQQNLNQIVIEYLSKKGYSKTEAILRVESAAQDAENHALSTDVGALPEKYPNAMHLLDRFAATIIDIYKPEIQRLLWPILVYSFLRTLASGFIDAATSLLNQYKGKFELAHSDDLRNLGLLGLPEHVKDSTVGKIYLSNKYRLPLSNGAYGQLIIHLESKLTEGGQAVLQIMTENMEIKTVERVVSDANAVEKILGRRGTDSNWPTEDEGIPGHNPGQTTSTGSSNLTRLKLGPLPMEPALFKEVLTELQSEDERNPAADGQLSLVNEFTSRIKQEESDDAPTRSEITYPASKVRDVELEVLKIKELRSRFKLDVQKDKLSACMYTFHNTHDQVDCIAISDDNLLIAIGTAQSYIRIFTMDGSPLKQLDNGRKVASERLIGHSGPVYNMSFSPAVDNPDRPDQGFGERSSAPYLGTELLLSCSFDGTIRLWNLGLMTCQMVYETHLGPVFDITWGPFGYYFLSAGRDKKAHLWTMDKPAPVRWFVGHDQAVDHCCFHPNGAYVFTAASDKTIRMWSCLNGNCVRLFTGHTGYPTAIACSPLGRTLATADDNGIIILWDLAQGKMIKRMRGHDRGGIWSLSWNVEGNLLLSGGMDGTIRLWDTLKLDGLSPNGKIVGEGNRVVVDGQRGNAPATASAAAAAGTTTSGGSKKKAKGLAVSGDQVSAFPTKQTPVMYTKFTRMNLCIAAGCYQG